MFDFIIGLLIVIFILWLCSKIAMPVLKVFIWLFAQVPFAIALWCIGILLCCTIILFPLGLKAIKSGTNALTIKIT